MANGDSEDQSTLIQLIRAVGNALLPLQVGLQDLDTFQELMMELGWEIEAFLPPVQDLTGLIQPIADALESAAIDPTQAPALLGRLGSFFQTVRAFASQPDAAFPGISNAIEFKNTFPRELADYLLAQYLLNFQPGIGDVLLALGILRLTPTAATASRIAYTKREVAWNDLGRFLSDPFSVVKNNYQWGSANFDGQRLIDSLAQLGRALSLDAYTAPLEDPLLDFLSQAADTLELLNLFHLLGHARFELPVPLA